MLTHFDVNNEKEKKTNTQIGTCVQHNAILVASKFFSSNSFPIRELCSPITTNIWRTILDINDLYFSHKLLK